MPTVGETIAGKYRVEREIGAGGMGTVVAATHLQLGTPVALKFLSDKIKDSPSSVERFTREAKACAGLRGEHVCRVTDFGMHADMPYIAMELLEGIDLAKLIATARPDAGMAVDFLLQACAGLAEAHAHGIVHRDLKPGNLFLTRRHDGTPLIKVLDFGVAKFAAVDDVSLTKTSHIVGSPGYMAPEQLRSSKTVDTRADIWALGVILYELISSQHPFHAEAVTEIALKIAMDEPPPLTEGPDGLRAVVMRCLEKEPDNRFADIASLAAALAPFAHVDRAAAIAAAKLWIEKPAQSTARPAISATAPTQAAQPQQFQHATTHQVGHGVVEAPPVKRSSRVPVVVGVIGVLVIGGLVAFAVTRGGGEATIADASVVATVPPPVDAAVVRPPDVIAETKPTAPTPPKPPDKKPDKTKPPKPPDKAKDKEPSAWLVPPKTKPEIPPIVPAETKPAEDDQAETERQVARAAGNLRVRGLTYEELGKPARDLQVEIARASTAKDWVAARAAATKLVGLVLSFFVDNAFITKKVARLTAAIDAARIAGDRKVQLLKMQSDAQAMQQQGNYVGANLMLNQALALVPPTFAPPPIRDPY